MLIQGTRMTALAILIALSVASPTPAAVPQQVHYQGRLADTAGLSLDTTLAMTFRIYDAITGGSVIWSETHSAVVISEGLFNVILGSVNALGDSVFSDSARYLSVTIGSDPELSPRTRLVSVPYTHRVGTVDGAEGGTLTGKLAIGPGHNNSGASAFVAGEDNQATGSHATVGGGQFNHARGAYSTIAGGGAAAIADSNGAIGQYATISGGWRHLASGRFSTIAGGDDHTADADYSTVGGGKDNGAGGTSACVAGGQHNNAGGEFATIGGGFLCAATGDFATVPGGRDNVVAADFGFAAGRNVNVLAAHAGAVVFADTLPLPFYSDAANEFAVRATGGVRLVTAVDGIGNATAGACLSAGSGSWASCSDRSLKSNVRPVNTARILHSLAALPITEWNYTAQDETVRHIGPMAQDFHRAFALGDDPRFISVVDADGIALAAIQELHRQTQAEASEKDRRIEELERRVDALERLIDRLTREQ